MGNTEIVIAGASGDLGSRISKELLKRDAKVKILVRSGSNPDKINTLHELGAEVAEVNFESISELTRVCSGATCVISALAGLRDVIVDAQSRLLEAAVKAEVSRFIPSDFSIDFTKFPAGLNRNLELRREFHKHLDATPISVTSILNGMFADLLTGRAPMILFKFRRVIYWENADQQLDFTTIDNTAEFTAEAALDKSTPRFLRIAGDQCCARELVDIVSDITRKQFRLLHAGSLKRLNRLIKVTQIIVPQKDELYPPWQGMQYTYNMFSGLGKLEPLDNDRYQGLQWTSVRDVLSNYLSLRQDISY